MTTIGVIMGDTRSLDNGSHVLQMTYLWLVRNKVL